MIGLSTNPESALVDDPGFDPVMSGVNKVLVLGHPGVEVFPVPWDSWGQVLVQTGHGVLAVRHCACAAYVQPGQAGV